MAQWEGVTLRAADLTLARALLDLLPYPALWIEPDHRVAWANRAARQAYGREDGTCHALSHGRATPCHLAGEECPMSMGGERGPLSLTHAHMRADGHTVLYQVVAVPVDGGGLLELHLEMSSGVAFDVLTGLYRRDFWSEIANRERDLLLRLGQPYGVLFVDVDDFKRFNDRWGHAVGDGALVEVAAALRAAVRSSDTAGRYGGDEFVVFLPHTDAAGLREVAERLDATVRGRRVDTPAGPRSFTVSVGAHCARPEEPLVDAVAAADRAMYAAKEAGRGRRAPRRPRPSRR